MRRHITSALCVFTFALSSPATANIIITLEPFDEQNSPIAGAVPSGTLVFVDILLSVDAEDSPLDELRQLRFDFSETSSTLELGEFTWTFDSLDGGGLYLTDEDRDLLQWEAAFPGLSAAEGDTLSLDEIPVRVAVIEVTVNATGTLDAIGPAVPVAGEGIFFRASFADEVEFSLPLGNVGGGTVTLRAADSSAPDRDGDGVPDDEDVFPDDSSESADADDDGTGDNADLDDDNDGVDDVDDAFPFDPEESVDTDGDGVGNEADTDDDGDGVADEDDPFPLDPEENVDSDGDGVGDGADAFPDDPEETTDSDADGLGNNADPDDDNDGIADADDEDPLGPNVPGGQTSTNRGMRVTGGFCGLGTIGASFAIWCGIMGLRRRCYGRTLDGDCDAASA